MSSSLKARIGRLERADGSRGWPTYVVVDDNRVIVEALSMRGEVWKWVGRPLSELRSHVPPGWEMRVLSKAEFEAEIEQWAKDTGIDLKTWRPTP